MLKTILTAALALGLPATGLAQTVDELVARNVAARGGAEAWRAVSSLRFSGRMDVGQGMRVPYVLEQKRPNKMRLELVFDGQTAVQCVDGKAGWKLMPFLGRTTPTPMTEEELREAAESADLYPLLLDYAARGHVVELLGQVQVKGRDAFKLKVTLPGGAVRWVFLDAESGLEVKIEAVRTIAGRTQSIRTFYHDWQSVEGILIPHRQETRVVDDEDEFHLLTVDTVFVNPPIDDARFTLSASNGAVRGPAPEMAS